MKACDAAGASARLSLSSLRAHKRRFAGTFPGRPARRRVPHGTLVMGDTLRASFDTMFGNASSGTDAVVRSTNVITTPGESQGTRQPVAASLAKTLADTPGRRRRRARHPGRGPARRRQRQGDRRPGPAHPRGQLDHNDPELNPYRLAEGRPPSKTGEVVVNRGAAKKGDLKNGDTTTLRTPDPVR